MTKAEFIGKGDSICAEVPKNYNKLLAGLRKELKKGQTLSKTEENLKAAVPPIDQAIEEFEQMTPPKGEEEKAEAILQALEGAAKGLEEEPEAELTGPKSPFAEFAKLTKAYGFQFCSTL